MVGEKSKAKPITPSELEKCRAKAETIPPEVVEAFNEMIAAKFDGKSSTVYVDEVVKLIRAKTGAKSAQVCERKWLDVEAIFEKAGWRVEYDQPAYNENYRAYFVFTPGR